MISPCHPHKIRAASFDLRVLPYSRACNGNQLVAAFTGTQPQAQPQPLRLPFEV